MENSYFTTKLIEQFKADHPMFPSHLHSLFGAKNLNSRPLIALFFHKHATFMHPQTTHPVKNRAATP